MLVSRALNSAATTVAGGMNKLAESMGDFWSTSTGQEKYVSLEDVVAEMHLQDGGLGNEMVFDSELLDD